METSSKTGFAQIFSRCPKNLSCPKFGGAAVPLAPPARTPMAAEIRFAQLKEEKPPMLFILKKRIQANSPNAEPGPLGLSTLYFTIQSNCSS